MRKTTYLLSLFSLAAFFMPPSVGAPDTTLVDDATGASSNSITINAALDANLTATGQASVFWRSRNTGGPTQTLYTISRAALAGTGSSALQSNITVTVSNASAGRPFSPSGAYSAGVSLPAVSTTSDALGQTTGNGTTRFQLTLTLNAPVTAGNGNVVTTLTLVATAL